MSMDEVNVQSLPVFVEARLKTEPKAASAGEDAGAVPLDYIPLEHRALVDTVTQAILTCMQADTISRFEIGRQLLRVKELLEPGTFHRWVREEFGFKERIAEHLMNVYRNLGAEAHLFGRLKVTALYHLSMPSTPPAAIARVRELIQGGHIPKVREVMAIIEACQQPARRQETGAERLARSLRIATTALSDQTIADCEQQLGKKEAQRLDKLRMELTELLAWVGPRRPKAQRSAKKWRVDESATPASRALTGTGRQPYAVIDFADLSVELLTSGNPPNSDQAGGIPGAS